MAQDDLMRWFYWRYVENPQKYYTVRQVAKSTGLPYGVCLRQMRKLAIFDMLKTFKPESIFIDSYSKHLYRLHSNVRFRCKILYSGDNGVQSYQNKSEYDTYISSNNLAETKKGANGRVLNEL